MIALGRATGGRLPISAIGSATAGRLYSFAEIQQEGSQQTKKQKYLSDLNSYLARQQKLDEKRDNKEELSLELKQELKALLNGKPSLREINAFEEKAEVKYESVSFNISDYLAQIKTLRFLEAEMFRKKKLLLLLLLTLLD